jgi:hypothetical protein
MQMEVWVGRSGFKAALRSSSRNGILRNSIQTRLSEGAGNPTSDQEQLGLVDSLVSPPTISFPVLGRSAMRGRRKLKGSYEYAALLGYNGAEPSRISSF